jgi:pimeloyl-ACP methyl ester carboxylesterase
VATFALVHGAWHGGWAWDMLAQELAARGHRVRAPDLPCDDPDAGVVDYAAVVHEDLDGEPDAIVVGHSLAGLTVPLVPAGRHVYLCAFVPQPGRSLVDRGPEVFGPGFAATVLRDKLKRSYWPDLDAAAHDLQYPAQHAGLAARLRPQGRRPSIEPSTIDTLPGTPCTYVVCVLDAAITPESQRRMATLELGVEPVEVDSGHSPMLSCPRELAEILDGLARADA